MGLRKLALLGAAIASAGVVAATTAPNDAWAQNEQFIPGLVYRTGAYAPNGIPVRRRRRVTTSPCSTSATAASTA